MKTAIRIFMMLLLVVSTGAFAEGEKRAPRADDSIEPRAVSRTQADTSRVAPQRHAAPPGGVTANANGYGNYRRVNDVDEDIEPVVLRSPRSNPQGVGIDTTMYAYMKRISLGQYRINAFLTDGDTYVPAPGPLPLPAGYSTSGDPWVTANPNTNGVQPRTMYVAGTGQVHDGQGNVTTNSIFVWRLVDGEIVWNRTTIATTDNTTDGFLDKPSMTISTDLWNLGWTWVTYVKNPRLPGNSTIYLHRSIDGINYSQGVTPLSGSGYASPVVVVDSTSGYVWLVWLSYADNKIYIASTADAGFHWSTPVSFDAGTANQPLLGPGIDLLCDNINGPCVVGRSMLDAKYNPYDRSIGVVWHRREPVQQGQLFNQTRTDVFFNSFSTTSSQWRGVHKVNSDSSTNDQWNGALDVDDTGHYA